MEYDVICEWRLGEFTALVNDRLNKGWTLVGGISTMIRDNGDRYFIKL